MELLKSGCLSFVQPFMIVERGDFTTIRFTPIGDSLEGWMNRLVPESAAASIDSIIGTIEGILMVARDFMLDVSRFQFHPSRIEIVESDGSPKIYLQYLPADVYLYQKSDLERYFEFFKAKSNRSGVPKLLFRNTGRTETLHLHQTTIGSTSDANIVVSSARSTHRVQRKGNRYEWIGSGERRRLKNGDLIKIGDEEVIFLES
ncbi:MAG: hypothetical protein Q4A52_03610 [Bacillota bacterium]|nr:hypothetical protein [Bacillota bacterium]